ncbi:MAG: hypothetical protein JSU98_16455 [Gemmatimonadales bacterium]|jgi:hypothetical protein|nr:MAG: hypothetical protein JSU98_16455 [Gemmatimonadales bacterium]
MNEQNGLEDRLERAVQMIRQEEGSEEHIGWDKLIAMVADECDLSPEQVADAWENWGVAEPDEEDR